jgi:hypothetical protein
MGGFSALAAVYHRCFKQTAKGNICFYLHIEGNSSQCPNKSVVKYLITVGMAGDKTSQIIVIFTAISSGQPMVLASFTAISNGPCPSIFKPLVKTSYVCRFLHASCIKGRTNGAKRSTVGPAYDAVAKTGNLFTAGSYVETTVKPFITAG